MDEVNESSIVTASLAPLRIELDVSASGNDVEQDLGRPLSRPHNDDIHLCICFFGLLRSFRHTAQSIDKQLFKVLEDEGIQHSVFLHTFALKDPLYNPRSRDFNTTVDTDYKQLKPTVAIIEDQNEFDRFSDFESYNSMSDPFDDEFRSVRNILREGQSLKQVTRLWVMSPIKCSHVFYTRPDLYFETPFNVTELYRVTHLSWFTGAYHEFGGYNDRFAFGDPEGMKIWGNRIELFSEYSASNPMVPEPFMKFVAEKHNISHFHSRLCLRRYRSNGLIDHGVCSKK